MLRSAYSWNQEGDTFYNKESYTEAIKCYDEALKLDPKYRDAWSNKGVALYKQGKYSEAEINYEKALEINPRNADCWNNKGYLFCYKEQYIDANQQFVRALEYNKKNPYTLQAKAVLYFLQNQLEDAQACFVQAEQALSSQNKSFIALAYLLTQRGRLFLSIKALIKAKEAFEQALDIFPGYIPAGQRLLSLYQLPFLLALQQQGAAQNVETLLKENISIVSLPIQLRDKRDALEQAAIEDQIINLSYQLQKIRMTTSLFRQLPSSVYFIHHQQMSFDKSIGRGGYGEVFKANWNGKIVAVKKLYIQPSEKAEKQFCKEVRIIGSAQHENIIKLQGISIDINPFCLIMKYMDNGDLYHYIHSAKPFDWILRLQISKDIVNGLAFLHKNKILHRDLKPANILLSKNMQAKLSDFGLSKIKEETRSTQATDTQSDQIVGTDSYIAPELLSGEKFTGKSDIYSFGITLWEIVARQKPFKKIIPSRIIPIRASNGLRDDIPDHCPQKIADLIKWCWDGDPEKRPSSEALKNKMQALNL